MLVLAMEFSRGDDQRAEDGRLVAKRAKRSA